MTLSEEVYQKLKEDINTLVIKTNDFLNEQQLAEQYGVSKAPVRSALHRLCVEGILVSYPRKGYVIVLLNDSEFQQAQSLRAVNEGYAAELVCAGAKQEELLELKTIAQTSDSVRDNMKFHLTLAKLSGNVFLYETVDRLLCAVTRTLNTYVFGTKQYPLRQSHTAIADALLERDAQKAKALNDDGCYTNSS